MKIVLRKWGGFTGKAGAEVHAVDVDALPGETAAHVRQLVSAAAFAQLPARLVKPNPQPWDFLQSLTIEDGGTSRSVEFHSEAASPELNKLAAEVKKASTVP